MTFAATLPAGELAGALAMASRVARSPNAQIAPVLSHLRLTGKNGQLVVRADDTNQMLDASVEAKADGQVVAPAHLLAGFVKTLDPKTDVRLATDKDQHLAVSQGAARFRLPTMPVGEFAPGHLLEKEVVSRASSASFISALETLRDACDISDPRQIHQGVWLDLDSDRPAMAATNNKVFGAVPLEAEQAEGAPGVIIPQTSIPAILAVAKTADDVCLRVSRISFALEGGAISYRTKVVDGSFPRWRDRIRGKAPTVVTVPVADVLRAITRTLAAELRYIRLDFGQVIKVSGARDARSIRTSADLHDEIEAIDMQGPPHAVLLVADQLKWAVSTLADGKNLAFEIINRDSPIELRRPSGPRDDVRVLMPVRG